MSSVLGSAEWVGLELGRRGEKVAQEMPILAVNDIVLFFWLVPFPLSVSLRLIGLRQAVASSSVHVKNQKYLIGTTDRSKSTFQQKRGRIVVEGSFCQC